MSLSSRCTLLSQKWFLVDDAGNFCGEKVFGVKYVVEDEADGDGEMQDKKETAPRPPRGRSPTEKNKVGKLAKSLAGRGKLRSSGSEPVDEAARRQYYAEQEARGLRLLRALDDQQKKQIAVKWVQTAGAEDPKPC